MRQGVAHELGSPTQSSGRRAFLPGFLCRWGGWSEASHAASRSTDAAPPPPRRCVAKDELDSLLASKELKKVPILLFANKCDVPNSLTASRPCTHAPAPAIALPPVPPLPQLHLLRPHEAGAGARGWQHA